MQDTFPHWFERKLGVCLDLAGQGAVEVVGCDRETPPLWAVTDGRRDLVTCLPAWRESIGQVVAGLTRDELFSFFGVAELARVLLPEGSGCWGPALYYVADEAAFRGRWDERVTQLSPEQVAEIDFDLFWHCAQGPEGTYFGLYDEGRLAALAVLRMDEGEVWEVGVDVVPEAKGSGLGRAVVGSAGRFVLEHGRLVLATTAPWNLPSARLMRSLGMRHLLTDLRALPAPFQVPPQMLGSPAPGVELRQYYPDWAMNRSILPKDG
jgi:RimJ/RimL family protein N-acetyltransferase